MIIFRYFTKEVLYTMLAVTTIAVFIFICNSFVKYLGYVASGKYAAEMLIQLILLQVPLLFGLLLPLGLFLGILLGYGRLYADSEMTVLMACGLSRKQIVMMTLVFSTVVFIFVAILNLWVNPIVANHRDKLMDVAETGTIMQTIMPGRFQSSASGNQVFYVESMSRGRNHMHHIFVATPRHVKSHRHLSNVDDWTVVSARKGYQYEDKKTGEHYMVAQKGHRYQGHPGQGNYQITSFDQYGVRMNMPHVFGHNEGVEILPTSTLIKTAFKNRENMAELQWRLSVPLTVLVLALLAVPLSRVKPRQGRFAHLVPAILIYVVYVNMLFVSRNWLEDGSIPAWVGLWWTHIAFLGVALWFYKVKRVRA